MQIEEKRLILTKKGDVNYILDDITVCRECGCTLFYDIPEHIGLVECVTCGHPNDRIVEPVFIINLS